MTLQRKKEIGISVLLVLYSALFFFGFALIIGRSEDAPLFVTIVFAILGLLWVALMAASYAFVTNRSGTNILITLLPSLALFLAGFSVASLVGAVLLAILLFAAQRRIHTEMNDRMTFSVTTIFYQATRLVMFGGMLGLVSLALPLFVNNASTEGVKVPDAFVQSVLQPVEPLIEKMLPGYKSGYTVDQFVNAELQSQLSDLPPGTQLPPNAQDVIKQDLSKRFGLNLRGNETFATIIASVINDSITSLTESNSLVFVLILIVIGFLAIRAIIPFLVWPVLLFIKGITMLALSIGLVVMIKTQVTVERISL